MTTDTDLKPAPATDQRKTFAILAFVAGLIAVVTMVWEPLLCIVTMPLALTFGIVSRVRKERGRGLAIAGIVLSTVPVVLTVLFILAFGGALTGLFILLFGL